MTEHAPAASATPTTADHRRRRRSPGARLERAALRVGFPPIILLLAFLVPLPVHGGRSLLGLPDLCPFRNLTGYPCPGCGISRSLVCLAHGRLAEAIRFHPLGPLVFAVLLASSLLRLPLPPRLHQTLSGLASPRRTMVAAIALALLTLAVWAARLSGALPSPP